MNFSLSRRKIDLIISNDTIIINFSDVFHNKIIIHIVPIKNKPLIPLDIRCLIERKEGALKDVFSTSGRYYILDDSTFFKHEVLGVGDNEYVSREKVKVLDEIVIPNVYDYLCEQEKKGIIKIYYYPNRPLAYPDDDGDLIECAICMYLKGEDINKSFELLEKYHPELHDRIIITKDYLNRTDKEKVQEELKYFK